MERWQVLEALGRLLSAMGETDGAGAPHDLREALERYKALKSRSKVAELGRRASLGANELQEFELDLRSAARHESAVLADAAPSRNRELAEWILASWLEAVQKNGIELNLPVDESDEHGELQGIRRIRALERILRDIVRDRATNSEALDKELRQTFGDGTVDAWTKLASGGDAIDGTSFSEIANMVTARSQFERYESLFHGADTLALYGDSRRTLAHFLDDIRRIRNILAHGRRTTLLRLQALDLQYEEITAPIQRSFEQGETRIDPSTYLGGTDDELRAWVRGLEESVAAIHGDLDDLRGSVERRLGSLDERSSRIGSATDRTARRTAIGLGMTVVVIAILLVLTQLSNESNRTLNEIDARGESMELGFEEMRVDFEALTNLGGIKASPRTPQDHYHNALVQIASGNEAEARRSLESYFQLGADHMDAHLEYVRLLKSQDGLAGARTEYARRGDTSTTARLMSATLLTEEQRLPAIEAIVQSEPDFAPAHFMLAREVSGADDDRRTLGQKRRELEALERFVQLDEEGRLRPCFLDRRRADAWREEARQRLEGLEADAEALATPIRLGGLSRGNKLAFTIEILDLVTDIEYRFDGASDWTSTGHLPHLDPRTGAPVAIRMINSRVFDPGPIRVELRYTDARGVLNGPFTLVYDQDAKRLEEGKAHWESYPNWAWFRETGSKVDFCFNFHLFSPQNMAIEAVFYSIDDDSLDQQFLQFAADFDPAIHAIAVPPDTRFVRMKLTYFDGTESRVRTFDR